MGGKVNNKTNVANVTATPARRSYQRHHYRTGVSLQLLLAPVTLLTRTVDEQGRGVTTSGTNLALHRIMHLCDARLGIDIVRDLILTLSRRARGQCLSCPSFWRGLDFSNDFSWRPIVSNWLKDLNLLILILWWRSVLNCVCEFCETKAQRYRRYSFQRSVVSNPSRKRLNDFGIWCWVLEKHWRIREVIIKNICDRSY